MVNIRSRPIIGSDSVRSALEGLLFKRDQENPLFYLTLVDQFLSDADLPLMEHPRKFALQNILTSILSQELASQRQLFQLEPPDESDTLKQAEKQIQLDGQQQAPELVGWSVLYYRYVRDDLNISPSRYAELASIDPRTFRRHQRLMIDERLPDLLADVEWQARTWHRQLRLHSVLPNVEGAYFVGRQEIMQQVKDILDEIRPQHILITGAKGVGKTTFVDRLLRQMINSDVLDFIVWISKPRSIDQISQLLHQELHHHDTQFSIKDYTLVHRIAVVLDDVSLLDQNSGQLQTLCQDLNDAILLTTNLIYVPLSSDVRHIVLPDIDRRSVSDLIKLMHAEFSESTAENYADDVWQYVRGNPFAIKMLVNAINNLKLSRPLVDESIAEGIFRAAYAWLDTGTQTVLFMLHLFPVSMTTTINTMRTIWKTTDIHDSHLILLLSCGLVRALEYGEYVLDSTTQQFIQTLYAENIQVKSVIDELVTHIQLGTPECLLVVEHILYSKWPPIESERAQNWLESNFDEGLRRGHYAIWLQISETYGSNLPDMQLNRAICFRRLGQVEQAVDLLDYVVREAGSRGKFDIQGRALIELSGLLRQQGMFEAAQDKLQHIQVTDQNSPVIALEKAQITFERGEVTQALSILQQYSNYDNIRALSLFSEIYLRLGNFEQCERYIQDAIELADSNHFLIGRLRTIWARIIDAKGDESRAEFELAIALLEHAEDRFGLARCQANFAATLIDSNHELGLARRLLSEAESSQILLNDVVGLIYTRHNLDALDRTLVDEM